MLGVGFESSRAQSRLRLSVALSVDQDVKRGSDTVPAPACCDNLCHDDNGLRLCHKHLKQHIYQQAKKTRNGIFKL